MGTAGLADVLDPAQADDEHRDRDGQHEPEHVAPAEQVEDQARDRGPDRRRDRDDDRDVPIITAASSRRTSVITVVISSGIMIAVPPAWTIRAASEQHLEARRERGEQRAAVNRPIAAPKIGRVGTAEQEAGDRDDHGHGEHERRWSATAPRRR